MRRLQKKGFEFGFAWIFAILAGSVILFLALYATRELVTTSQQEGEAKTAQLITNALNPLETNLEDTKHAQLKFRQLTRLHNNCDTTRVFGRQQLSTTTQTNIGSEWTKQTTRITSYDKYVFSRETVQGKIYNIITKPYSQPYKVGDLTLIYANTYCFVNPTNEVEKELNQLTNNGKNDIGLNITKNQAQCPEGSTTVCFGPLGCDITVHTNLNDNTGIVTKNLETLHYTGPLLYAAIFADPGIYECQVKRLTKRTRELAYLYANKAQLLTKEGCSNTLEADIRAYADLNTIQDSSELKTKILIPSTNLKEKNEKITSCRLF